MTPAQWAIAVIAVIITAALGAFGLWIRSLVLSKKQLTFEVQSLHAGQALQAQTKSRQKVVVEEAIDRVVEVLADANQQLVAKLEGCRKKSYMAEGTYWAFRRDIENFERLVTKQLTQDNPGPRAGMMSEMIITGVTPGDDRYYKWFMTLSQNAQNMVKQHTVRQLKAKLDMYAEEKGVRTPSSRTSHQPATPVSAPVKAQGSSAQRPVSAPATGQAPTQSQTPSAPPLPSHWADVVAAVDGPGSRVSAKGPAPRPAAVLPPPSARKEGGKTRFDGGADRPATVLPPEKRNEIIAANEVKDDDQTNPMAKDPTVKEGNDDQTNPGIPELELAQAAKAVPPGTPNRELKIAALSDSGREFLRPTGVVAGEGQEGEDLTDELEDIKIPENPFDEVRRYDPDEVLSQEEIERGRTRVHSPEESAKLLTPSQREAINAHRRS